MIPSCKITCTRLCAVCLNVDVSDYLLKQYVAKSHIVSAGASPKVKQPYISKKSLDAFNTIASLA